MAKASHHLELVELATFEEGGHQVRYDEAGRQILLLKHHEFTAVPYGPGHDLSAAALPCANNGPVLDVRFAPPPLRWVCIQRAATLLELRQLDGPAVHLHQLRPSGGRSSERILSMHWTGSAFCDLLVLGTWGADMLVLGAGARGPKRVRAVAFGAAWALYSAETRMAALGGGKKDNELCCFQIGSGGVVRVPKFEVELPQPAPAPTDPAPPARSLRRADVRLLCSRGLIFLVHLDGPARQLVPYQLFRDYVLRKPALRLPAARLALSQVDGLLAVHCLPAGSEAPSAAGAGANEPGLEDTAPLGECRTLLLELEPSGRCQPIAPALPIGPRPAVEAAGHAGGERWAHWTLLAPSAVVDHSVGRVYELRLDLRAIAASCGAQPVRLLSLLLGRTGAQPEVSAVLTAALREQRPAATLRALFDLLHAAAGREAAAGGARGALLREAAAEETAGELSGCVAAAGSPASPSLGPERGAAQPAAPSPAASVSSSASSCAACAATPAHASTATASSPLRPRPALAPSPGCCLSARQIGSIFEAVEAEAAEQPSRADGHEGSSAAERAATILEYLRSAAAHGCAARRARFRKARPRVLNRRRPAPRLARAQGGRRRAGHVRAGARARERRPLLPARAAAAGGRAPRVSRAGARTARAGGGAPQEERTAHGPGGFPPALVAPARLNRLLSAAPALLRALRPGGDVVSGRARARHASRARRARAAGAARAARAAWRARQRVRSHPGARARGARRAAAGQGGGAG